MPSQRTGRDRKHSCLMLQFARRYSGEACCASLQVNGPHCGIPGVWWLGGSAGEVETATFKTRERLSGAGDSVFLGPDQV